MRNALRAVVVTLVTLVAAAGSASAAIFGGLGCAQGCNRVSCRDAGIQNICRKECSVHEIRNCLAVSADAHGKPEATKKPCEALCSEAKCRADASLAEMCRNTCSALPDIGKRCPAPAK